jgi:hypothetical protein
MDNTAELTTIGFAKCDGHDIELKLEVFEKPIARTENNLFFSRIRFVDMETGLLWGCKLLYFQDKLTEEDGDKHFAYIKEHIENYKEKIM